MREDLKRGPETLEDNLQQERSKEDKWVD